MHEIINLHKKLKKLPQKNSFAILDAKLKVNA
jgi:hypothetical protein